MSPGLKELLQRVATWPQDAQAEAVASLLAIEQELSDPYELTEDDRAAIDRGLYAFERGDVATDEEVRAVFDKYR